MALTLDALRRRLLEQAEQDEAINRQERDLNMGVQRGESDLMLANQRDESEYGRNVAELGQQHTRALTGHDEQMADQGIVRSGMNLTGRGRIGENFAKNSEALARRLSGSKEDRARQLQQMKADQQMKLGDLNVDRARIKTDREQQKAVDDAERSAEQVAAQAEQTRIQQEEAARLAALQPQYTPTGQFLPPDPSEGEGGSGPYAPHWADTPEWQAQNALKPTGDTMPEWQRMGFPSAEAYTLHRRLSA